jgi:maleate isomerase
MVYVDGWRGRIGLITPAPGSSTEAEFHVYAPEGVGILTTRVPLGGISVEALVEMGRHVDEAASVLAGAEVDVIVFACTAGSFVKGAGYDKEIIERLEDRTGISVTTTSTGLLEALTDLEIKRLAVATPYPSEVNKAEKAFLESSGIEVAAIKGLELQEPTQVPQVRAEEMFRLAKEVFTNDVDGVFISCTGLHVLDIIDLLEMDFNRPVLTSNQVTLFSALRKLGVVEEIEGLGTLFSF